ncbi:MAG: pilus assembly protein TadG-related protein [Parvularculaceae bacterium]
MGVGFLNNRNGNVALTFALVAPALFCAAGIAIDFRARVSQRDALQDAADTLALRGARELLLENSTEQSIEAMLAASAERQFGPTLGAFAMKPDAVKPENAVTVEISQPSRKSFFLSNIAPHEDPIVVSATAVTQGVTNMCVIALEDRDHNAIKANLSAALEAPKCAILSNSTSPGGIEVSGLAKLSAAFICSGGGYRGSSLNYSTQPLTDCPAYSDPLADRTPPSFGGCDHVDLEIGDHSQRLTKVLEDILAGVIAVIDATTGSTLTGYTRYDLQPGVYCGGISIASKADVHFAPGEYIMNGGALTVDQGARLYGENVGFYFADDATFDFRKTAIIHLTAPKTGLMAGILFWESAEAGEGARYAIKSSNARTFLGTIYLPKGVLQVQSAMPIADNSAYTALVIGKLSMTGSPSLVLNADYGATDVPTPEGVGPTGGTVFLRE